MPTVYSLLNQESKNWWYHRELRKRGETEEARKRERQSIKSTIETLRKAKKNSGYGYVGRGGWSIYTTNGSSLSGHERDVNNATIQSAIRAGIVVINTLDIPEDSIWNTVSFPMIGITEVDNPREVGEPYGSMSYAPLDHVLSLYENLGATIYNWRK